MLDSENERKDEIRQERQNDYYNGYFCTGGPYRHRKASSHFGWIVALAGAIMLFAVGTMIVSDRTNGENMVPESTVEQQNANTAALASQLVEANVSGDNNAKPEEQSNQLFQDDAEVVIQSTDRDLLSLQEIYKKVITSVVSITAEKNGARSTGTGIIMSADGLIITNYHVADGAANITVLLESGEEYAAELIGGDELSDLMVLKIDATGLQPAEFGDSTEIEVGDSVVAIGDPLGIELRGTMTDGIICGISRDVEYNGRTLTLIQTNAALNAGNSGGPLVNMRGQVIGINTMKLSSYSAMSASVEGIGFAIPISTAKPIIEELARHGFVAGRPATGFTLKTLDIRLMYYYDLPSKLCIWEVDPDSDAANCGLKQGDVVIALQGEQVSTIEEFNEVKNRYVAGDTITMTVSRKGVKLDVSFVLMDAAGSMNK